MIPNPSDQVAQRKQQLEQAKAQRDAIQAKVRINHECIRVLVEAGADPNASTEPLIVALIKMQLVQLRVAVQDGETALANLEAFIKHQESPLFGASLVPPNRFRS